MFNYRMVQNEQKKCWNGLKWLKSWIVALVAVAIAVVVVLVVILSFKNDAKYFQNLSLSRFHQILQSTTPTNWPTNRLGLLEIWEDTSHRPIYSEYIDIFKSLFYQVEWYHYELINGQKDRPGDDTEIYLDDNN